MVTRAAYDVEVMVESEFRDAPRRSGASRLFSVRVWQEKLGANRWEWRSQARDATSSETRYFRDWDTLLAFFQSAFPNDVPDE